MKPASPERNHSSAPFTETPRIAISPICPSATGWPCSSTIATRTSETRGPHPTKAGPLLAPQSGSISVMLSNVYLHNRLDLWFERVVKPRLRGEAYMLRYIDDFVLCCQYREDALRVHKALCQRLGKFSL